MLIQAVCGVLQVPLITPQQIENKLVDFYLKTTGHYGNSVMRSIDVTTETLTDALDGIEDPINTFENVIKLQETKAFCKFLSNDYTYWGMVSKFRYIVFLCYVAAQDGIESANSNMRCDSLKSLMIMALLHKVCDS